MSGQERTLLFCWELGAGSGHISRFEPLARRFLNEGWKVVVAARSLSRVPRFFPQGEVDVLQAPFKSEQSTRHIALPKTFSQMMENLGYRDSGELDVLIRAWRSVIDTSRPDLIIFDHSPTALLAARGRQVPKFTMGSGFSIPRNMEPLPDLAPWWQTPEQVRLQEEQTLLKRINQILERLELPVLTSLSKLYSEVQQNLLLTYAELDHYGPRSDVEYFGNLQPGNCTSEDAPRWPKGSGPRVFAYLRSMPALMEIIRILSARNVPTIAVVDEVPVVELAPHAGRSILLTDRPVSLERLAQECDLSITYAAHGTMCRLLRAGVPQMMAPISVEQGILSDKVQSMKAGLFARQGEAMGVSGPLNQMLDSPRAFPGAAEFQKKYSGWSQEESIERLFQLIRTSC